VLRSLGWILLIVVFGFALALAWFNAAPVPFDYLAGSARLSLALLLLVAVLVGAAVVGVIATWRWLAVTAELRRLRRALRAAEGELQDLRRLSSRNG
jgi:Protein of unknown function (DUF1049).